MFIQNFYKTLEPTEYTHLTLFKLFEAVFRFKYVVHLSNQTLNEILLNYLNYSIKKKQH